MKNTLCLVVTAFAAIGTGLLAPQSAAAAEFVVVSGALAPQTSEALTNFTGPSGQWTNTVSGPTNVVWDATTLLHYQVTNIVSVVFSVVTEVFGTNRFELHQNRVGVTNSIAFQQDGAGKLVGAGTNTVYLGFLDTQIIRTNIDGTNYVFRTANWTSVNPFPGSYKVTGLIRSSRGLTSSFISSTVVGLPEIRGAERHFKSNARTDVTINNSSNTIYAAHRDSASAAGEGSVSSHAVYGTFPLRYNLVGDGTWTLNMTLSTTGKAVTGSAVVTLNSGRTFQFSVKGAYKSTSKNQQSLLVLTGSDASSKGSVLQVKMNADAVASIKGRISGQMVGITF